MDSQKLLILQKMILMLNPGPAEPGYAMSLQTVKIQIRGLLPSDLDLYHLSFSM